LNVCECGQEALWKVPGGRACYWCSKIIAPDLYCPVAELEPDGRWLSVETLIRRLSVAPLTEAEWERNRSVRYVVELGGDRHVLTYVGPT
jgi:hypothetical protein